MAEARLLGIVGPTASGKSALALRLAQVHGAEVVSCDSLQVYRGLDIGSAKPTRLERQAVPHHLIDIVEPDADFSAAEYARQARRALDDIRERRRLAIVVGGTGLYLRALLHGLFPGPARDELLRRRLEGWADRFGDARLHRLLAHVDPAVAGRLPTRDRLRIVRALEVFWTTGRPLSSHHDEQRAQAGDPLAGYDVFLVGLDPGRVELRRRVTERTRGMLAAGLLDEVRTLVAKGFAAHRPLAAIGYRQALDVLAGRLPAERLEGEVVKQTMRYAKRQMTWFRHQVDVEWFVSEQQAALAVGQWLGHGARGSLRPAPARGGPNGG